MKIHPAADCLPRIAGSEFDLLVEDIHTHGLLEPIALLNGEILDGRNRYAACAAADVAPHYVEVDLGSCTPVGYVMSLNLTRRHLSPNQRAHIAADLANLEHGGQGGKVNGSDEPLSTQQAATQMNVSPASVKRAKRIKRENPEAHEAAKRGTPPPPATPSVPPGKTAKLSGRDIKLIRSCLDPSKVRDVGKLKQAFAVFNQHVGWVRLVVD